MRDPVDFLGESDAGFQRFLFHHGQAVLQKIAEVHFGNFQLEFPRFDLGKIQDIVDQRQERA